MGSNARTAATICERNEHDAAHTFGPPDGSSASDSQATNSYCRPLTPVSFVADDPHLTKQWESRSPFYLDPDSQAWSLDPLLYDGIQFLADPMGKPSSQSPISGSSPPKVHRENVHVQIPMTGPQTAIAGGKPTHFQTTGSGSISSKERRSFNMDLIDPVIESNLNTRVEEVVRINGLSNITKGRKLKDTITDFYEEKADKTSAKNRPSDAEILDICCNALEGHSSINNTVVRIVEEAVARFEKARWYLPRNCEKQLISEETTLLGATSKEPLNQSPIDMNSSLHKQRADKRPKSVRSPRSVTPLPKRQKKHSDSSRLQSLAIFPSVSGSRSSGPGRKESSWKCCENGCEQTKPFTSKRSFKAHYLTHFPSRVMLCPLKNEEGELCTYMTERSDNMKSHVETHKGLTSPTQLQKDLEANTIQIKDMFHEICPFCETKRLLQDAETSRLHILTHYEDGSSKDFFDHRCSGDHFGGDWKFSTAISSFIHARQEDENQKQKAKAESNITSALYGNASYDYDDYVQDGELPYTQTSYFGEVSQVLGDYMFPGELPNYLQRKATRNLKLGGVCDTVLPVSKFIASATSEASFRSGNQVNALVAEEDEPVRNVTSTGVSLTIYLQLPQKYELFACGQGSCNSAETVENGMRGIQSQLRKLWATANSY